ncbi:alpha/beta fold hydrolase [Nocardioides sp. SR21]|uniref:alpha/beta fold hydrolase n=1 Tax=Nocardioides sp. SR21 TaxID=2919501 RepID=UPI001FAA99D4|nr:alpha/beta hydrolase [Nocardioides sp. SR21]
MTVEHSDVGSGPPVLFVHGSPGGCDQGELMTRFLAGSHRVIAPSRPGYRGTPLTDERRTPAQQAELALGLMDSLSVDRFDVVCWSGGGPSSYLLAAAHPDRVRTMVAIAAVSTSYHVDLRRRVGMAEEKLLMNRFGTWLAGKLADSAPSTAVKMLLAEEGDLSRHEVKEITAQVLDDEEQRAFALGLFDTVTGPRKRGFDNDMHQYAELDLPLGDVTAPVLLVHARGDADVAYEHSTYADQRLPSSLLVTLEGGTHVSAWLGPDAGAVQAAIREHLGRG